MRALFLAFGLTCASFGPTSIQDGQADEATHLGRHLFTIHGVSDPSAVAFDPSGDLWVTGKTVRRFDAKGDEVAGLSQPAGWAHASGVTVDRHVYVASESSRTVTRTDLQGGNPVPGGPEPAKLCSGSGLATFAQVLAVADPLAGHVWLTSDGESKAIGHEQLSRPMDVAWSRANELFVIDADTSRVEVFDAEGEPLRGFGAWGAFPGLLADPHGIDVWNDRVFVADTANHRVQVFTLEGKRAYTFGQHAIVPREGKGKLHYPSAIAISKDGSRMAIAEPLDDRVQVFGRSPGAEPPMDPLRPTDGQPSPHFGFDLDADGTWMVVTEPESGRVHLYDTRRGKEPIRIATFGGRGAGLLKYMRPSAVDVDLESRSVLVCDPGRRILEEVRLRIDPTADLAQHLGAAQAIRRLDFQQLYLARDETPVLKGLRWPICPTGVLRDRERTYVLDAANRTIVEFDTSWTPQRMLPCDTFGDPRSITMGADGLLWVTDAQVGQVLGFQTRGSRFGEPGPRVGAGRLEQPHGVLVLEDRTMYVSDAGTDAVIRFDAEGNEVDRVGSSGLGPDQFRKPRALAQDGEGRLIVNDHANHRGFLLTQALEYVHAFGSRPYAQIARDPKRYPPESYVE
tara:strand:- start:13411 stop:15285 length:1875 start_codon:yes stop_codon:yes gene_type:complete